MRKILHICTSNEYTEGFSYQDNLLTKYMSKQGWKVYLIASPLAYDENGKTIHLQAPQTYVNSDGVTVTRLPYNKPEVLGRKFRSMKGFAKRLEEIEPEVIFIHLPQTTDSGAVINYVKKHPKVKIYCDNHADFSNSASGWISKNILHGIIWKFYLRRLDKYTEKFYGVIPARVDFLTSLYGLPSQKCELLVMGADDEYVEASKKLEVRSRIRASYGFTDEDRIIITGGKIDKYKPEAIVLMEAVNKCEIENLHLLVFGSVSDELKNQFEKQLSDKVRYIGWRKTADIYSEFSAADIIAFPGLHSVLWEQAVAMEKPCLFRKIPGFTHIDIGGNCLFFEKSDTDSYIATIKDALNNYDIMNKNASSNRAKDFLYSRIAKRAVPQILEE